MAKIVIKIDREDSDEYYEFTYEGSEEEVDDLQDAVDDIIERYLESQELAQYA